MAQEGIPVKVNKENMEKWIAALESGRYTQIKYRFIGDTPMERCAVGVGIGLVSKARTHATAPSERFYAWIGLPNSLASSLCVEEPDGDQVHVIEANDAFGLSFSDIAQRLRKKYL